MPKVKSKPTTIIGIINDFAFGVEPNFQNNKEIIINITPEIRIIIPSNNSPFNQFCVC